MTDQQHPITPPPELVASLRNSAPPRTREAGLTRELWLINQAYQDGADQELEACRMEIVDGVGRIYLDETKHRVLLAEDIWIARRSKPPSLKEQALEVLGNVQKGWGLAEVDLDTIRRALEQLND